MGRSILLSALLGLGACASADRIDRKADSYAVRAQQSAADGNVKAASKEQKKADKLASKANTRRGFQDVMPIVFH